MRYFSIVVLALLCFSLSFAQTAEEGSLLKPTVADRSPYQSAINYSNPTDAPFDLQSSFDLQVASGDLGNAGAEFDGTYYYTTRWASNLIHRYDMSGN
ncbi:MAG: hypothetical protein WAN36_06195, partial [Calditrichia bacterium]